MKEINLEPGEVICPECNGKGTIIVQCIGNVCPMCWGAGKLDWIENIVGKKSMYITLPKLRNVYPKLLIKEIINVQPMREILDEKN